MRQILKEEITQAHESGVFDWEVLSGTLALPKYLDANWDKGTPWKLILHRLVKAAERKYAPTEIRPETKRNASSSDEIMLSSSDEERPLKRKRLIRLNERISRRTNDVAEKEIKDVLEPPAPISLCSSLESEGEIDPVAAQPDPLLSQLEELIAEEYPTSETSEVDEDHDWNKDGSLRASEFWKRLNGLEERIDLAKVYLSDLEKDVKALRRSLRIQPFGVM